MGCPLREAARCARLREAPRRPAAAALREAGPEAPAGKRLRGVPEAAGVGAVPQPPGWWARRRFPQALSHQAQSPLPAASRRLALPAGAPKARRFPECRSCPSPFDIILRPRRREAKIPVTFWPGDFV